MPVGPYTVTPVAGSLATLTPRELQILKLVAEGKSDKDMAKALFRTEKTVQKHRASLMAKLGLHGTAALTSYAIQIYLTVGEQPPDPTGGTNGGGI
jgi:DNA-binding NarL/FixJ family response regulator